MSWFLTYYLVNTSSKTYNLKDKDFNPEFNLEYIFTKKTWKVEEIIHDLNDDLNQDLILYWSHNPLWMPDGKVIV